MTTTFGWDMSHFDAPSIGNAIAEGVAFIAHKAGGDKPDPELAPWWENVKEHRAVYILTDQRGAPFLADAQGRPGILPGAYWVVYPGSAVARADAFLARLDDQCPGWRNGPFFVYPDCEKWHDDSSTVPPVYDINAFCDRLTLKVPKLNPCPYVPEWVYGNAVAALRYPLWASSYVAGSGGFKELYPGDGAKQWDPYGGKGPSILQYSSSATIGGQTTCDANAFRGDVRQLVNLLAPGWSNSMTVQDDVTAALHAFFDGKPGSNADGQTEYRIGHDGWWQPVPNVFKGGQRTPAWILLTDLANKVAAGHDVDPAAIAAAVLAGLGDDVTAIADLILAGLPSDLAKQVADELAARLAS